MSGQASDESALAIADVPEMRHANADTGSPDRQLAARLDGPAPAALQREFAQQGAFLYLDDFLPGEITARLAELARALLPAVNRNYLPGHKQGGSVSRHTIDKLAPYIAELYRSRELIAWLESVTGDRLLP